MFSGHFPAISNDKFMQNVARPRDQSRKVEFTRTKEPI